MLRLLQSSTTIDSSELTSDNDPGCGSANVLAPNTNGTYALWRLHHVLAEDLMKENDSSSKICDRRTC
jgi:hypothetical protein